MYTQKRESEEADISEAPARKRRVALINSRKLIHKVISRVKLRKFDENLIEKTEMIVNRKSCDFTNIECHFKTDVTKVIHAIMEMEEHSLHESEESEQQRWQKLYGDMTFVDDVHRGKLLKRDKVIEARKIEMEYFRKMGVHEKVHRSKARGYKVITTRWVDTNRGVGNEDNYRSRLIGRELNRDKRHDLFAPTPPLETMTALISLCAKSQDGREPLRFATIDIKRAYFYAPATRKMFIKLPAEDMVGELKLSLYGTRDAAMNWGEAQYTQHLNKTGFQKGRASACNSVHESRNTRLTCHGDDFIIVAP